MMSFGGFIFTLGLLTNPASLESALDCYDSLDYVCAEQQLAIALRAELTPEALLAARKLDILIAFAWRDDKRIDAGAKRLFKLDPGLVLTAFPADLAARIESHRPEPPEPSSLTLAADYRLQTLAPSSEDGHLWMSGEGARLELGYFEQQRLLLSFYLEGIKHFAKQDFSHESLDIYESGGIWRQAHHLGPMTFLWGLGIGASAQRLEVKDAYEPLLANSSSWRLGAAVSFASSACVNTFYHSYVCMSVDPKLLVRVEGGQPQTSYLFPLGIGLRYDYRLNDVTGAP
jgi:hypothetical protein